MKVLAANMAGVKIEEDGQTKHFVKAGSRWPMTIARSKSAGYYPYPFWLGYTLALLKRDTQAKVRGIDGVARDLTSEELFSHIERENPDLLITELATLTIGDDLLFLDKVKQLIGAQIAICGGFVTAFPERVMHGYPSIDYIFLGEYELTAQALVNHLIREMKLDDILGLVYRDNGKVKINGRRPLISNLDILPFPDRDDFPPEKYSDFSLNFPCIQMISSRGCPFGCIFCVERHVMYASPIYRRRSAKSVVDEMELCIKRYGARQIYFDDQSFTVNKKHVLEICDEILERNLDIPWTCMGDAMCTDYEMLKKMRKAGCIGMKFGVESSSPEILKAIRKPIRLEKVKRVVEWCKRLGIRSHATFCIGLPGETMVTLRNSMIFAKELKSDTIQIAMAVPYPGTPFFEWAEQNNYLITEDWCKYDGTQHSVLSYPELSNTDIELMYQEFSKLVSRKRVTTLISSLRLTIPVALGIIRERGLSGLVDIAKNEIKNAI